jgi:hypothetical protein
MGTAETREAAFIAKVTAGATHEIRNVLAIIKESAGLIEDVIRSLDQRRPLDRDKVLRSVGRIDAQVSRGAKLVSNLNRFAHSLDRTRDTLDLNQEIQQAAFLCQRFARQKSHLVQVRPGDQDLPLVVNSLRLQMAVFAAVECCLDQLPEPGTVNILTGLRGDRPSVEFIGEVEEGAVSRAPTEAAGWGRLAELLDGLGALVEPSIAECRFVIILPLEGVAGG